jgi:hypothetical protein
MKQWLRGQLQKTVLGLASLERTIARQCSRIHWLQEGDANTHFFHVHASIRKRRNHIFRLRRGNVVVTDQVEMEALATTHYVDLSMYDYIARIQATLTTPMISTPLKSNKV